MLCKHWVALVFKFRVDYGHIINLQQLSRTGLYQCKQKKSIEWSLLRNWKSFHSFLLEDFEAKLPTSSMMLCSPEAESPGWMFLSHHRDGISRVYLSFDEPQQGAMSVKIKNAETTISLVSFDWTFPLIFLFRNRSLDQFLAPESPPDTGRIMNPPDKDRCQILVLFKHTELQVLSNYSWTLICSAGCSRSSLVVRQMKTTNGSPVEVWCCLSENWSLSDLLCVWTGEQRLQGVCPTQQVCIHGEGCHGIPVNHLLRWWGWWRRHTHTHTRKVYLLTVKSILPEHLISCVC